MPHTYIPLRKAASKAWLFLGLLSFLLWEKAGGQNITDSFSYTVNTSIGSYTGWSVPSGTATVTSQYARSSRSLRLAGEMQTQARRSLGGLASSSVLYADFWIRPVVYDGSFETAVSLDGSLIGFTKEGPTGKIYVSHGETAEGNENWIDSGFTFWMNRDGCTASDWIRVSIRQDSVNGLWDLYVNGKMFLGNLAFKDRGADPGYLVLLGGSLPADFYVDDLKIWASNPVFTDSDLDGMENAFETAQGYDTGANDRELESSQAGVTRLQHYLNETHTWFAGQWAATTADTDVDGMADSWELFFGLDPNDDTDGVLDLDGDGVSNADEYLLGTTPTGNFAMKDIGAAMAGEGAAAVRFQPVGINNLGEIIGSYPQTSSIYRYVVWRPSSGATTIFTNTETTAPRGLLSISDSGVVAGFYKPLTPDNAPLFWWEGSGLQAVPLPQSFTTTSSTSLGSVYYEPMAWMDYFVWFEDVPAYNSATGVYDITYLLSEPGWMTQTEFGENVNVTLWDTETLAFSSAFIGMSDAGKLVGTYSSEYRHTIAPDPQLNDFYSYLDLEGHISSGSYSFQTGFNGATPAYVQTPQNDWSGSAYRPVDMNGAGEILGSVTDYADGMQTAAGAYVESSQGVKTILEHSENLPLTPLKLNRLGHSLLKVTGSSPAVFGLARGGQWVPLDHVFPAGISFTPAGLADDGMVVGNTSGVSFGPALLTDKGITRLANAVPNGEGWLFNYGTIAAVSDTGMILGMAPKQGDSFKRCFLMWRADDQDEDGLPDDWERKLIADAATSQLITLWDVRPGDDADGDGLSNWEEYLNGTAPAASDAGISANVGLTVFSRLE